MATNMLGFQLPWQGLQAGGQALSGLGGDPKAAMANLGNLYQQQYQSALDMNRQLHDQVQTNYGTLRNEADQVYSNIYKNLDARYGDVLGRIAGTNTSNIRDIEANARAASAAANQNLISRGLGNSTIVNSANRGINSDRQREITRSNEQFAQLGAGYADRIWQERTNAQQNKAQHLTNLGLAQNAALERVNAGYPDAQMFSSLAQMYGAQSEADKNRKLQEQAMARAGAGVQSSAGYSYSPSPWGSRNPAGANYGGSWGGDSWTGSFGGGGGGYYQPYGQGGNYTTPQNPFAGAMGNAAVYGMGESDPYGYGYYDQVAQQGVDEAVAAAANW